MEGNKVVYGLVFVHALYRSAIAGFTSCVLTPASHSSWLFRIAAARNGLTGPVPTELASLTGLDYLSLSRNDMTGTIPTELSVLPALRTLLLNRNSFVGRIPTELGQLPSISYLHLGNNRLSGSIPPEVFTRSMQNFDVGYNRLTGVIPAEIYTVSRDLVNIDLSSNLLVGNIPSGSVVYPTLNSFTASNNSLTGVLPVSLLADTLSILDVAQNRLGGTIPNELFDRSKSLTFFNVGENNFRGTISERFGELIELQTLVLFFNLFIGTIPAALDQLTNLGKVHNGCFRSCGAVLVRIVFMVFVVNVGGKKDPFIPDIFSPSLAFMFAWTLPPTVLDRDTALCGNIALWNDASRCLWLDHES